jgi:hypothetical protein
MALDIKQAKLHYDAVGERKVREDLAAVIEYTDDRIKTAITNEQPHLEDAFCMPPVGRGGATTITSPALIRALKAHYEEQGFKVDSYMSGLNFQTRYLIEGWDTGSQS